MKPVDETTLRVSEAALWLSYFIAVLSSRASPMMTDPPLPRPKHDQIIEICFGGIPPFLSFWSVSKQNFLSGLLIRLPMRILRVKYCTSHNLRFLETKPCL